jgi:hypothetical protein
MSDTMRTGTEELLLSNAVDRAINEMNFKSLAGKDVYFDNQYMHGVVDEGYVVSSLRQHLLASGCVLKANREEATYIVEARVGALGTNRHDVLIGVPSVNLPNMGLVPGVPSSIPEIPFAKSTQQKGVAKLAVFAYNQHTGQPVWQSGAFPVMATARDTWVLGTGPFQRGSIYEGTRFAGSRILLPFQRDKPEPPSLSAEIPVTAEAVFFEPPIYAQQSSPALGQTGAPMKRLPTPPAQPPIGSPPPPGAPPQGGPPQSVASMAGVTIQSPPPANATPGSAVSPTGTGDSGGGNAADSLFLFEEANAYNKNKAVKR